MTTPEQPRDLPDDHVGGGEQELWCLHITGMDDVHPAPDRATAQLWAVQHTVTHHRYCPVPHYHAPVINFTVAPWPWSAEAHANGLAQSIADNTFPIDPLLVVCKGCNGSGQERWRGRDNSEEVGPCSACVGSLVKASMVETVASDFGQEAGKPFWRIEIDGFCADFEFREAAENFARSINHRISIARSAALVSPPSADAAMVEEVARLIDPMPFKHHRALYEYCLACGDTEADARRVADDTHKPDCDRLIATAKSVLDLGPRQPAGVAWPSDAKYRLGDTVAKKGRASWRGHIVGWYRTDLTALGYAVESAFETGSVQIYPDTALVPWLPAAPATETGEMA